MPPFFIVVKSHVDESPFRKLDWGAEFKDISLLGSGQIIFQRLTVSQIGSALFSPHPAFRVVCRRKQVENAGRAIVVEGAHILAHLFGGYVEMIPAIADKNNHGEDIRLARIAIGFLYSQVGRVTLDNRDIEDFE